ncbi:insulinase family protein, partial [bacterium]|nr:insulinase family protein [bacterium]
MLRVMFAAIFILMINALLLASVSAKRPATALDEFLKSVKRTSLPNGLTVLTREQKGTGVVAINTWVKAGYFNEPDEVAGMAHLFEHMFFKGSKKFPGSEQIAQQLANVGGLMNAGTIYDYTNYYFVVPYEGFRRAMEIQSDAIMNPLFNPEELKKEAEVVIEESNRKLDNPPALSTERMYSIAFQHHRMKRWRIGSNEVLRNINRENLIAFFQTLYRPENMILVIAGDVSHEEAVRIAKETFGELPRGKVDKKYGPKEPLQTEFRYGRSSADIKQGYSVFGWHTVGVGHKDELTLDLLATILGSGRSSRLYRNVVNPDSASTIYAIHYTFDDIGVFEIQGSFDEKNRSAVDRKTLAEVERLKAHGPNAYELQLAKNKLESYLVFGLQDVLGQAQALSQSEARYGYEAMGQRLAEIHTITAEQIQETARRYLTVENLTLYHYTPKEVPAISLEQALLAVQEATSTTPPAIPATPLPAQASPVRPATTNSKVKQEQLSNGVTLILQERPGAPMVSTGVYFKGGRIYENSGNAGITQLLARSMRKGTKSRSGDEIDNQIEYLGTQMNLDIQEDYFGVNLSILSKNYKAGIELLADVLMNPSFPQEGVNEERFEQVAAMKRSLDSSLQRPFQLASEALYGSHPYGLPPLGYQTSVSGITSESLREWWQKHVVADDTIVLIVGDISAEEAKSQAEHYFGKLSKRSEVWPVVPAPSIPSARMEIVEYRDRKQSAIVLAFPTVVRTNPEWPILRLLGNVTSGLAGTFFAELRSKQALAYTVFARDSSRVGHGAFVAYMATEATKEPQAREALLKEIRRLASDGFNQEDVNRAKSSFAGTTKIILQTNDA